MASGVYKALFNFVAERESDLSLHVGDVVFVSKKINRDWYEGTSKQSFGQFPSCYVKMIFNITPEKIGVVINSFAGDQNDHLSLTKGDVIGLTRVIDEHWSIGYSSTAKGVFPTVCVQELCLPKLFTSEYCAVAINNFCAQEENDLTISVGDYISLILELNDFWLIGVLDNKKGKFPKSFVKILNNIPENMKFRNPSVGNSVGDKDFDFTRVSNSNFIENQKLEKIKISSIAKAVIKPSVSAKPKHLIKKDKSSFQSDYQFELIDEKIFDMHNEGVRKVPSIKRKAPPLPITSTGIKSEVLTDLSYIQPIQFQDKVVNSKKLSQPRTPISMKNSSNISQQTKIVSLPISSPNTNSSVNSSDLITVSFSKEKQLEFSNGISRNENDQKLSKALKTTAPKKSSISNSSDKSVSDLLQLLSPIPQGNSDSKDCLNDQFITQRTNLATEKSCSNLQKLNLHQIEMEIAQLKSKLEFEAHQLTGVETLLNVVSKENRKDLLIKQEHHETIIIELNDNLHALEDEKSYLLASFGKIEDVKHRVDELEKQIEQYLNNCEQLRCMQDFSDIEELPEIRDNIIFCENMVDTLQDELSGLKEKLCEFDQIDGHNDPEKLMEKQKINQQRIVEELINTEEKFITDVSLITERIKLQLENDDAINVNVLFGNLVEIVFVSQKLLSALKNAVGDASDQILKKIASCFLDLSMDMKQCYSTYCRNYDDVQCLLEKFEEEPAIQQKISNAFLSEGINSGSMALPSYLIKPVQRVLKYPLLLSELFKNSFDDESNSELKLALNTMNDVAAAINEFKRRKDLVLKYRETEEGIGKKVQKLNWHSVAKKSSRINQRITQFTGLNSHTVDEKFNIEEKRFRSIEKMIKLVLKNITQYIEIFKENSFSERQCAESLRQFYDGANPPDEIIKYYGRIFMIAEQYSSQMVSFVMQHVQEPLSQILQMFQGPFRLIQKRNDKCLDYDRAMNKAAKARDTRERDRIMQTLDELNVSRNVYIALNTQLLEELPVLSDKCSVFLKYCLSSYVDAHVRYLRNSCVQINEVWKLPFLTEDGGDNRLFIKVSEQLSNLVFTPLYTGKENSKKTFLTTNIPNDHDGVNSRQQSASLPKNGSLCRQSSPSDALALLHFSVEPIPEKPRYIVKYDFTAECDAEITVQEGTAVSVCRTCDSKGNSEWWLVEQGGRKGYIPQTFLVKEVELEKSYRPKNTGLLSPAQETLLNMDSNNNKQSTQSFQHTTSQSFPADLTLDSSDKLVDLNPLEGVKNTTFLVEYNFEAINPGELTVCEGQFVRLIRNHDSKGNNEWWFVEYNGKQGFVPQDYLKAVNKSS